MVDPHAEEPHHVMSSRKKTVQSSAMKRTSEWIFSQEIPSDVTVFVEETSFALHKFPLVSKSGYIRKLVTESSDKDLSEIRIPDVPGGPEGFEFAAKFCYGINFEISTDNIAMLRCMAEFLEMTEEYAVGNLVGRTEAYLHEVALKNLAGAITVLHSTENLLPIAERVKLVSRCVDAIAFAACKESQLSMLGKLNRGDESLMPQSKHVVDWWAEDLTVLKIDVFQRVIIAMLARGLKYYALGPILMLYVQKSLRGLDTFGKGRKKIEQRVEHEKRVVLETIVSLLPREKNALSVSFLSLLLRAAICIETTVACRLDLEKRMAFQLEQAVLDDLLIPSYSFTGDTLFDVDTVQRIMTNYLEFKADEIPMGYHEDDEYALIRANDIERVGKLMENYLAEIASDRSLPVSKIISVAELIPEQSRVTEDGMYRAIDIYLKAHPALSDLERKKVCSLMDCQKLSREACAHAAQNDRLPVQTVVQVLFFEQQRLRDAMGGSLRDGTQLAIPSNAGLFSSSIQPIPDELTRLRRENAELKMDVLKMKTRVKELEKAAARTSVESPRNSVSTATKPPLGRKSFIVSMGKKLGRFYPFMRHDPHSPKGKTNSKTRRHSIS